MATERIVGRDGTVTIVSDSYAPFGELPVAPTRAEDPAAWHPQRMTEKAVCGRYGATVDDLIAWQEAYGFPKPSKNVLRTVCGSWSLDRVREWDIPDLDAFDARIRAMAARLPRR